MMQIFFIKQIMAHTSVFITGMQNFLILAGTTILIVFSIVFLTKICKMQKER